MGNASRGRHSSCNAIPGEQIRFLKSFIPFGRQRNVVPENDLLTYTEAVAIDAAYLHFKCDVYESGGDESLHDEILAHISKLMERIKIIDPWVNKTCTEALKSLKSARALLAPPIAQALYEESSNSTTKNFLDSLISMLCDELRLNKLVVVSVKDQPRELYEGLWCLRKFILKQQEEANHFDMKIKEDIIDLVCDAGVFIFSFCRTHVQLDLGLEDLLGRLENVLADHGDRDSQVPAASSFCSTTLLAFVDFLLEKLMELTNAEVEPTFKSAALTFQEELVSLRSLLGDISELCHEQEELQVLWDQATETAYKVEFLIDYLVAGDLLDSFSTLIGSLMKEIGNIKSGIKLKRQKVEVNQVPITRSYVVSQSIHSMTKEPEVIGLHDEANTIIERLDRGLKKLRIVAIVGMPGLGKTTLAEKVYRDPRVSNYFAARAFTTVSQTVDKREALLNLLKQVAPDKGAAVTSQMTADDVVQELWRSLKGMRYLIALDDIWDAEAWNILQQSFPDDSVGSRIILTSRCHDVAFRGLPDEEPHKLRPLNTEESMDLLQRKLFDGNGWPTELGELGVQVVEVCKGLPLTLLIIAGILKSSNPEDWKKILDGLSSSAVSERCKDTLELSYKCLPEHLKPCFLYFAAFPEDEQIGVRRLLQLWMAEGFVRKVDMKRLGDVAEEYLKDLIGRSLIMVSRRGSIGRLKSCRIHDLLHEFCLQKVKEENFFHFVGGESDELWSFNKPRYPPIRLCIQSKPEHFIESNVFSPRVRSLRFNCFQGKAVQNMGFMMHICKILRVLDLGNINLGHVFPHEVGMLGKLAFLAIYGRMDYIHSAVGNLSNLETFILHKIGRDTVELPENFWNLQKLKNFKIAVGEGVFSWNHDSSPLYELDRISGVLLPIEESMEGLMRKFPNIRRLKCLLWSSGYFEEPMMKIVVPDFLHRLESLHLSFANPMRDPDTRFEFNMPENLKKLTLSSFYLCGRSLSSIAKMPNLEVLKLLYVKFDGGTWTMEEDEFSKLRHLELHSYSLLCWICPDDQFSCLEKLVLCYCVRLQEIPSCLENIPTLQMIDVNRCSDNVAELARKIGEVQLDYGNSDIKINITLRPSAPF